MIDDQNVEDFAILDYMKFLYSKSQESLQAFQSYRDYDQNDNLSLLHHAAKNCRHLLCDFLINTVHISKKNKLFMRLILF